MLQEQLDQQLQVTSPRGWIALTAIWALLAAIIAWSLLGTVPTKEEGEGILVTRGGLKVVEAPGDGRLLRSRPELRICPARLLFRHSPSDKA